MRNKYLTFGILSLAVACGSMTSCGKTDVMLCMVTFRQENYEDIIKSVNFGGDLQDIPTPHEKTGYTVTWDRKDFANIKENIVVNAVNDANSYTVTYRAPGFEIDGKTVELTYDSPCSNLDMTLTKSDKDLLGWKYDNKVYTKQTIWDIANDVTLIAEWKQKDIVTVTFIDTDGSYIYRTVYVGQDLLDIPTPKAKTGYTVAWDRNDFTKLQEDLTVNVIATAKSYTVTFDPNGGTVDTLSTTVTYDQPYTFGKAFHDENRFVAWKYNELSIELSGTWQIDEEDGTINLAAEWGDSEWTDIH